MSYAIKNIAVILKGLREHKHISQSSLGKMIGIPQSHISKIESGFVDIKLTSLLELARTLDHEVMLIPRNLIPTIESIIRTNGKSSKKSSSAAYSLDDEEEPNQQQNHKKKLSRKKG